MQSKEFYKIDMKPFMSMIQVLYQNEVIDKEEKKEVLCLLQNFDNEKKEILIEKIETFARRDISLSQFCESALKILKGE